MSAAAGSAKQAERAWDQAEGSEGPDRDIELRPIDVGRDDEINRLRYGTIKEVPEGPIGRDPSAGPLDEQDRVSSGPPAVPKQDRQPPQAPSGRSLWDRPRGTPAQQAAEEAEPAQEDEGGDDFWEDPAAPAPAEGTPEGNAIQVLMDRVAQEQEQIRQEKHNLRNVIDVVERDPLEFAAKIHGVDKDQLLQQYMQQRGLSAPASQDTTYASLGLDPDDTDPQTKALVQQLSSLQSRLDGMQSSVQQREQAERQRWEEQQRQSQEQQRLQDLSRIRDSLAQRVQKVPALRKAGSFAPLLIENAMGRIARAYEGALQSGEDLDKLAAKTLRDVAMEANLGPQARAEKAARQRDGRDSGPMPPRPLGQPHRDQMNPQPERRANYSDDATRKAAAMRWLAEARRAQQNE